jgi:hypothetical protein
MMKVVLALLAVVALVHCHVFPMGIHKHKVKSLKGIPLFFFFFFFFCILLSSTFFSLRHHPITYVYALIYVFFLSILFLFAKCLSYTNLIVIIHSCNIINQWDIQLGFYLPTWVLVRYSFYRSFFVPN